MKINRHACIVLVLAFLLVPFSTGAVLADGLLIYSEDNNLTTPAENNQTVIIGSNKYGYLNINSMDFVLMGTSGEVTITYTIDSWIELLVFLFGKENMKERVLSVLNYPDSGRTQEVKFRYIDSNKAILSVSNVVMDNTDGSYWFYQHEFGTTIPIITFHTSASDVKTYTNTKSMERGFGYFQ
ncbi:MAG: hypothetical protein Q4Q53_05825 [Methanocorpusculum sp.]|nr:hypothetical protein [Methanocorpusculum sp.]